MANTDNALSVASLADGFTLGFGLLVSSLS